MGVFARLLGRSSDKSPGAVEAAAPAPPGGPAGADGGTDGTDAREGTADAPPAVDGLSQEDVTAPDSGPAQGAAPDSGTVAEAAAPDSGTVEASAVADSGTVKGAAAADSGPAAGTTEPGGVPAAGAGASGTDPAQRPEAEDGDVSSAVGDGRDDNADRPDGVGIPKQQSTDEAADSETGDSTRR